MLTLTAWYQKKYMVCEKLPKGICQVRKCHNCVANNPNILFIIVDPLAHDWYIYIYIYIYIADATRL